jgi:carbon monoxide dehydrogenase subunit G
MRTGFAVAAPADAWARLGDPDRLATALPGCRSVTRDGDGLRVVADVAVASVRGLWSGTVTAVDGDAVRIAGSGSPGSVDLVARASADRREVTVDGTVEGPLATVGGAVLAAAVRRLTEDLLAGLAAPRGAEAAVGDGEAVRSGGDSGSHERGAPPEAVGGDGGAGHPLAARATAAVASLGALAVILAGRRAIRRRRYGGGG